jgi:hypothetical protein
MYSDTFDKGLPACQLFFSPRVAPLTAAEPLGVPEAKSHPTARRALHTVPSFSTQTPNRTWYCRCFMYNISQKVCHITAGLMHPAHCAGERGRSQSDPAAPWTQRAFVGRSLRDILDDAETCSPPPALGAVSVPCWSGAGPVLEGLHITVSTGRHGSLSREPLGYIERASTTAWGYHILDSNPPTEG